MTAVVVALILGAIQIALVATMKGPDRQFYGSLTRVNLNMALLMIVLPAVFQA